MNSFLLGFGAGAIGGILLAPRAGKHYRHLIRSKAVEGVGYLKQQTEGLRGSASDVLNKGKEAVGQHVEKMALNSPAEVYQR